MSKNSPRCIVYPRPVGGRSEEDAEGVGARVGQPAPVGSGRGGRREEMGDRRAGERGLAQEWPAVDQGVRRPLGDGGREGSAGSGGEGAVSAACWLPDGAVGAVGSTPLRSWFVGGSRRLRGLWGRWCGLGGTRLARRLRFGTGQNRASGWGGGGEGRGSGRAVRSSRRAVRGSRRGSRGSGRASWGSGLASRGFGFGRRSGVFGSLLTNRGSQRGGDRFLTVVVRSGFDEVAGPLGALVRT